MPTIRTQKQKSAHSASAGGKTQRGGKKKTEECSNLYGPNLPYSPLARTTHESEARLPSYIVSLETRYRLRLYLG